MPKKTTRPESFFISFIGEYVQIITNVKFSNGLAASKNSFDAANLPLIIEGFLVDSDEMYVYLSPDNSEIKQAVKNDVIVYIHIPEQVDEAEEILNAFSSDIKKRDMN